MAHLISGPSKRAKGGPEGECAPFKRFKPGFECFNERSCALAEEGQAANLPWPEVGAAEDGDGEVPDLPRAGHLRLFKSWLR